VDTIIYPFGVTTPNNAPSWGQAPVSLSWPWLGQELSWGKKIFDSFVERLANFYHRVYLPEVISYTEFDVRIC
jgi:hypothetical protein